MLIQKILSQIPAAHANWLIKKINSLSGGSIAHHGIQRSGTNYLNRCLWQCGLPPPINSFDEKRSSPRNKHCRWYAAKVAIPKFILSEYGNNFFVADLYDLNKIANYPQSTIHTVIKKEEYSWLASICNWGIACNWFGSDLDALENLPALQEDYKNYYHFWERMENLFPDKVVVLSLEAMLADFQYFTDRLSSFGFAPDCGGFVGKVRTVPQSPENREKSITRKDIEEALLSKVTNPRA